MEREKNKDKKKKNKKKKKKNWKNRSTIGGIAWLRTIDTLCASEEAFSRLVRFANHFIPIPL